MGIEYHRILNELFFSPNEGAMLKLINYSRENDLDDPDILDLANGLANSGRKISLKGFESICDIPSSGGPSSLSTLICPLMLKVQGNDVLALGVLGRPAGGIDVLAQISDYNINPNHEQIREWLQKTSYVHLIANEDIAPLDADFFQFRKEHNAIDIPALAITSILSKKIALGTKHMGLEIKASKLSEYWQTLYSMLVCKTRPLGSTSILKRCKKVFNNES